VCVEATDPRFPLWPRPTAVSCDRIADTVLVQTLKFNSDHKVSQAEPSRGKLGLSAAGPLLYATLIHMVKKGAIYHKWQME